MRYKHVIKCITRTDLSCFSVTKLKQLKYACRTAVTNLRHPISKVIFSNTSNFLGTTWLETFFDIAFSLEVDEIIRIRSASSRNKVSASHFRRVSRSFCICLNLVNEAFAYQTPPVRRSQLSLLRLASF